MSDGAGPVVPSPGATAPRSVPIRFILGLILGAALVAWFVFTSHWSELFDAIAGTRPWAVLLAALIIYGEFLLRTIRWRIILRHVAPNASFSKLFTANVIGAATNTLLPARAGDLARPLLAARKTGAPIMPLLASTVVERVFDLIGLLCVFLGLMTVLPRIEGPEGALVERLRQYGFLMGGAGLAGLGFLLWVARKRGLLHEIVTRLLHRLPERWGGRLVRLFDGFMEGLGAMRSARDLAGALLCTVVLWFNGVLAIFVLFHAFDLDLPLGAAAFLGVAIALTVALPQAPGFVGVFWVAAEKTLILWGLDQSPARGFAILFWAVSFLPVTATGLFALWREGLGLGDVLGAKTGEDKRPDPGPAS